MKISAFYFFYVSIYNCIKKKFKIRLYLLFLFVCSTSDCFGLPLLSKHALTSATKHRIHFININMNVINHKKDCKTFTYNTDGLY